MTTLDKTVTRKTAGHFLHYRHPLVVELQRGDVIAIRELRRRRTVYVDIHGLYFQELRRQIAAEKQAKKKARLRKK